MDFLLAHYYSFWGFAILIHFVALITSFLSPRQGVKAAALVIVVLTAAALGVVGLYHGRSVGETNETLLGWIWLFMTMLWCWAVAKQIRFALKPPTSTDGDSSCSPGGNH